jgi:Sec-independent protein translocase protein TatA
MTFFGLGGFEVLLIFAIALFVLGPKRLLDGIRDGRRVYSDLKRQRDALQSLITEAIDMEDLKKQVDAEGIKDTVQSLEDDLKLDQATEELRRANAVVDKSIPRDWQFTRPPVEVDSEVRDSIPEINITGGNDEGAAKKTGPPEVSDQVDSDAQSTRASSTSSGEGDEVKS